MLRVPSQALRFTPAGAPKPTASKAGRTGQQAVWVERDGQLVRVPVTVGLNDDTYAEIKAGDLQLGDQVVTAIAVPGAAHKPQTGTTPSLRL